MCPGYPGHNPEHAMALFYFGTNFPKYSRYFGKIAATHHLNTIIKISGIFRKNGPGFERNCCVCRKMVRGYILSVVILAEILAHLPRV